MTNKANFSMPMSDPFRVKDVGLKVSTIDISYPKLNKSCLTTIKSGRLYIRFHENNNSNN